MGKAQTQYVKETVKRTIVSNWLVWSDTIENSNKESEGNMSVIEAGLTNPQQFHCITNPLENKWHKQFATLDTFCGLLKTHLSSIGIHQQLNNHKYMALLKVIYQKFCKSNPLIVKRAKQKADQNKEWYFKDWKNSILEC